MTKFLTDIAPLIAFFIGYKQGDLRTATIYTVVASIVSLVLYFLIYRKLEKVTLVSTGILLFAAGITIATNNLIFIKMKPTILYIIFAVVIYISNINKRPVLKYMLESTFKLKEDKSWYTLGNRFVLFFIVLAVANEVIWRLYSDEVWVNFKVFCIIPITFIFIALQIPFLLTHKV